MTTPRSTRDEAPTDASWADEPLRAAELEELLVHGGAAVIATDLDGTITHWNTGAQRLYGWSVTETVGLQFLDLLVAPDDRRRAEENIDSIRRTGGWEGEFELRCKNGGSLLAYVRVAVIKDDAGRLVGMLGLSMDAAGWIRPGQARPAARGRASAASRAAWAGTSCARRAASCWPGAGRRG